MPDDALDPEIAQFVARMRAAWGRYPPFMTLPVATARTVAEEVRAPWSRGGPVMAATADVVVPVDGGPLAVRRYDPGVAAPAPALIYLHGGGFTLFSVATHDRLMREYAAAAGCVVLGVDYPLSPEARYPAALDAVVSLVDGLTADPGRLGVDPLRVVIGGDSAGANLALSTALRLRDGGHTAGVAGLLLNYGAFAATVSDAAEAANGGPGAVLDRAEIVYYFGNYVADPAQLSDPLVCPLSADLTALPPAFLVIPERDVLAEQSVALAARLAAAGVAVDHRVYSGATHSFLEAMSIAQVARDAIADGAAFVRRCVGLTSAAASPDSRPPSSGR